MFNWTGFLFPKISGGLGDRPVAVLLLLVLTPWPATALEISASTESVPPLNYGVDGKVGGFSSELLDLIAKEAGIEANKQLLPWARAYELVARQGKTMIYSLARTPEREALFQWVDPISVRRIVL